MSTTTETKPEAPAPEEKALIAKPERAMAVYEPDDPVSLYMDGGVFDQLQRVAKLMSCSSLVPDHLKGQIADCSLVAAQAFRWRMDPFAVAQHTFVLRGKLGYEGKLIAAVVNSNKKIEGRLSYTYTGEGNSRRVTVTGKIHGEPAARTVDGDVANWSTSNEQWKKDPDQMLAYRGARQWARRHMPEAMIGINAEEEAVDLPAATTSGTPRPRTIDALTETLKQQAIDVSARTVAATEPQPDPVTGEIPMTAEEIAKADAETAAQDAKAAEAAAAKAADAAAKKDTGRRPTAQPKLTE